MNIQNCMELRRHILHWIEWIILVSVHASYAHIFGTNPSSFWLAAKAIIHVSDSIKSASCNYFPFVSTWYDAE